MRKNLIPYLLLVPQIILTLFFIIGLTTGITQSLGVIPAFGLREPTLKYYREVLARPDMLKSVLYSLKVAFLSAGVATAAGVGLSAVCVMHKRTKGPMMRVIQLPIIVPHVVVAIFMVNIFSQNGLPLEYYRNSSSFPCSFMTQREWESSWHICGRRFPL